MARTIEWLAGAEVIQGDQQADRLELPKGLGGAHQIKLGARLQDFQLELGRFQPRPGARLGHQALHKRRMFQLAGADVDTDGDLQARLPPLAQLLQGAVDDPAPQFDDQGVILQVGDHSARAQQPTIGMLPPQQSFQPQDGAVEQIHLGLIEEPELVLLQAAANPGEQVFP
jgi:hypothetical protein